ncbi:MAG: chemotaxis-specific protein-glutamate methyltransferase CheB [Lachnospiraceae bacterium]|nr:chemotaxis-specific protein-glutamate methyltransferase CheB [Lachnospiraceae bacterium]
MNEKNGKKECKKKKNILVIDDSALMRRVTSDIINSDSRFVVTDFATNGFEALDIIYKNYGKYDAVVCDINMPKMNGIEVLKSLKRHKIKLRVIMSSTMTLPGAKETIMALELGAFDFVTKPSSYVKAVNSDFGNNLLKALYVACELEEEWSEDEHVAADTDTNNESGKGKVIDDIQDEEPVVSLAETAVKAKIKVSKSHKDIKTKEISNKDVLPADYGLDKLVMIASSTGGPKALSKVISKLDGMIDAPVVIVQHMPEGFTSSLAQRLDEISQVRVVEATDGEPLCKGTVYIARGGRHLKIEQKDNKAILRVYNGPAVVGLKPCADITIESLNSVNYKEILFVVMTGMGQDGTKGLMGLNKAIKKRIIAQDQKTSAVYGMPRAVFNAGLADGVYALDKIAKEINQTTGVRKHGC